MLISSTLPVVPPGVDVVADFERLEDDQHDPRGEVRERALQREADREAARRDHRRSGPHRNAEDVERPRSRS